MVGSKMYLKSGVIYPSVRTDCIHPAGPEDEEVILLFAQFVAQAECNAAAGQWGAPWSTWNQEDQPCTGRQRADHPNKE